MLLKSKAIIKKNVKMEDYFAVEGDNVYYLTEDDGKVLSSYISKQILWAGKGSPFPTPPGGPWSIKYVPNHQKFGESFVVFTDKESDVMIHYANRLSYGCLIITPTEEGKKFFKQLVSYKKELKVIQQVEDIRSEMDKKINPIDYNKIGVIK